MRSTIIKNSLYIFCCLCFFITLFVGIPSCFINNTEQKKLEMVKKWHGKQISVPQWLPQYKDQELNPRKTIRLDNKCSIIACINGKCPSCIEKLKGWQVIMENNPDIQIILIVEYLDLESLKFYIDKEIGFTYPIFLDKNAKFRTNNNLPENKMYHTMLLNQEGKVIIIGDPVNNPALLKIYINQFLSFNKGDSKIS